MAVARILSIVIISYLFLVAFMYAAQRTMQYFPDKDYPGESKLYGLSQAKEVKFKAEDEQELYAWFIEPKEEENIVFVIFHGNAGSLANRANKARDLSAKGYGVLLSEYRGYGGIKGKITEDNLYKDARAGIKWLLDNGHKVENLAIYGESLGSGIATQMAKEFNAKYLIFEGGFSSAIAVAKSVYPYLPVGLLLKDKYDNLSKIKDINASLLMLHGAKDMVVNIEIAKEFYEAANHPKQFTEFANGGHVDLFDYRAADVIDNWIKEQRNAE